MARMGGLIYKDFRDAEHKDCAILEAAADQSMAPALYLGIAFKDKVLINKRQAKFLIKHLQCFVETGRLRKD